MEVVRSVSTRNSEVDARNVGEVLFVNTREIEVRVKTVEVLKFENIRG